jgi:LacI family transcriptional regulator
MITIKDVAKLAGVSASTVSRAISGNIPVEKETRDKVMQAVEELHYEPNALAKGLKEGKTNTIGLIIPNIGNHLFPPLVKGVEETARKSGYTVILCNTENNLEIEKTYLEKMQKRLVDGFIIATAREKSTHILDMEAEGVPVVLLIRHLGNAVDAVILDNYKGAYEAVSYLLARGRKKIAIINGEQELSLYRERFNGYQEALKKAGETVVPQLVLDDAFGEENGYAVMVGLLRSGQMPDAVFATTDLRAIGAIRAIKDFGYRVPEDIAVIGFDDFEFTKLLSPRLTTVSQPLYDMGKLAVEKLITIMDNKNKVTPIIDVMEPTLVLRDST